MKESSQEFSPILVVDDDPDIRETVGDVLELEGYCVVRAANGQEALALLESSAARPALMLLDLMMPVMDGIELLKRLAASHSSERSHCPAVIMTASRVPVSDLANLGARGMLRKPFDIDELLSTVQRCSRGSSAEEFG